MGRRIRRAIRLHQRKGRARIHRAVRVLQARLREVFADHRENR